MAEGETETTLGPLTRWLVKVFKADSEDTQRRRSTYASLEGWVSIVVNTVLFVIKLVLGLVSGSIALIADAIHTFSDSLTSVVVIVSARVARRPPDQEHPFGHGRVESIATVTCAALLGVTAFEFIKSSIERILSGAEIHLSWLIIGLVLATVVPKEWLARFARALGRASGNSTLEAEFWHHRSDVLSTFVVIVGMIGGYFGLTWLDGLMGLVVSLLLGKVAYDIARSAIDSLLGKAPSSGEIKSLRRQVLDVDGVRGVHDIVVHRYGETRFISLHVETTSELDATSLHDLAEAVERQVDSGHHGSVCVHVDPINRDHPDYEEIKSLIDQVIADDRCAEGHHDLRLVGSETDYTIVFDVTLLPDCPHDEEETRHRLVDVLRSETRAQDVVVEIEPRYSYHR